jgi:predicted TIM-barrel fold metal-dependent hydrolase
VSGDAVAGYDPPPDRPSDFAVPAGFRFVDTHDHLFDPFDPAAAGLSWGFHDSGWEHPRLKGAHRLDDGRAFSVPQYRTEVAGLGTVKMVHVQAATTDAGPVAETAWLQSLADRHGWPNGIVAPCNLADPSAPDTLAQQAEFANFRGVRDLSDGSAIFTPPWAKGYHALISHGGTVDLMITLDHYDRVIEVAKRHPEATMVLEHCGLPVVSKLDAYYEQWRAALAPFRDKPNVVCKVSALSSAALPNFFADSIRRYVLTCIDTFGPDRCMFASNWPIDKLFVTYARLLAVFRGIVQDFTPAEQEAMFATTAERVYRI